MDTNSEARCWRRSISCRRETSKQHRQTKSSSGTTSWQQHTDQPATAGSWQPEGARVALTNVWCQWKQPPCWYTGQTTKGRTTVATDGCHGKRRHRTSTYDASPKRCPNLLLFLSEWTSWAARCVCHSSTFNETLQWLILFPLKAVNFLQPNPESSKGLLSVPWTVLNMNQTYWPEYKNYLFLACTFDTKTLNLQRGTVACIPGNTELPPSTLRSYRDTFNLLFSRGQPLLSKAEHFGRRGLLWRECCQLFYVPANRRDSFIPISFCTLCRVRNMQCFVFGNSPLPLSLTLSLDKENGGNVLYSCACCDKKWLQKEKKKSRQNYLWPWTTKSTGA